MPLPVLIFPQTALLRSTLLALWPLFEPVQVMESPALSPSAPQTRACFEALGGLAPLAQALSPARAEAPGPAGEESGRLAGLLRQWEQWLADHQGSGQAEAIKAGISLPDPDHETMHSLRGDIKAYGRRSAAGPGAGAEAAPPPEVEAALWLHLLRQQDEQAGELEGLLAQAEAGQQSLGRVIGLEEEDSQPADYEQGVMDRLPPLDHTLDEERQLPRRLWAWATLAAGLDGGEALLATDSLPAAQWLRERVNRRLAFDPGEFRSPAGAVSPLGLVQEGEADPSSPLAQEAFRLALPDLGGLGETEVLALRERLEAGGALEKIRQALAGLVARLGREPWSPALKEELSRQGQALAEELGGLIVEAAFGALDRAATSGSALSVLALPGLTRADLLTLMAGGTDEGLPRLADWPAGWPAGSLALAVIWP